MTTKKKKRKKQTNFNPKSREWLYKHDYSIVGKADSYNAAIGRSHDLFNFIDMVGIHLAKPELLAVQITSKGGINTRIKKAKGLQAFWGWLATGNPVEFHGWYKNKEGQWDVKIVRFEKPDWMY